MYILSVHYISNTFLSILAEPDNAKFCMRASDVSTHVFQICLLMILLIPNAKITMRTTFVFTAYIPRVSRQDTDIF